MELDSTYRDLSKNDFFEILQGGVGIRMPDRRVVGRSGRQAGKKKKDLPQKKGLGGPYEYVTT